MVDSDQILVNHEYKGVLKIKVDKGLTKVLEVTKDTSVEKGITSSLINYDGNIFYACKEGVYKYNNEKQTFLKDTLLSNLVDDAEYSTGKLVYDARTSKLWGFSSKNINFIAPGKLSSKPKVSSIWVLSICLSNHIAVYQMKGVFILLTFLFLLHTL